MDERSAEILREMEKSIVASPYLLSSFVMIAEKRFDQLERPSFQQLPDLNLTSFLEESVSSAFYALLHPDGEGYQLDYLKRGTYFSRGSMGAVEGMNANNKGTVQVLVGGHGASGVSSMVNLYAKASDRELISFPFYGFDFDTGSLARKIQFLVSGGRSPILLFDEIGKNSAEVLQGILSLVSNRSLIGNATVVLVYDGSQMDVDFDPMPAPLVSLKAGFSPKEGTGVRARLLREIVTQSDSVHFVRNPQTWQDYARIIMMKYHEVHGPMPATPEVNEALEVLAKAALQRQAATGTSSIREILKMVNGRYVYPTCNDLVMNGSFGESQAQYSFNQAVYKFWYAHAANN